MQTSPSSERKAVSQIDLKPGAHVHFMGICGTAMASLAGLLKDRGFKVTGSDQNVYPPMSTQLEKIGITIMEGYKRENLTRAGRPDLVIVGNVISRQYEEAQELLSSDIPFASLPQAMGQLVIAHRHSVVVSGTHGKTTTTSMMAWVLDQLGLEPGFLIGGIPKNFDFSYRVPKGDWFVIEGDEYDTAFFDKVPKFTHYRPRSVILTSVEFDHADIYRDLDHVKEAFQKLLRLLPENGVLVTAAGDANIEDLLDREADYLASAGRKVVTFAIDRGNSIFSSVDANYVAKNVHANEQTTEFEIVREGKASQPMKLGLIGDYNVKNALAAFALCETLGFDMKKVVAAIESFRGVKRRQEIIGKPNDITIIEDFAHHPTAVKQTIEAVQGRYPKGRVFSIFEFRSATSRRAVFQKDYADALSVAQALLIPPPFNLQALAENDRFNTDTLMSELRASGVDANVLPDVDGIVSSLKQKAKPGDVILVMSNGGFGGIYEKLLKELS